MSCGAWPDTRCAPGVPIGVVQTPVVVGLPHRDAAAEQGFGQQVRAAAGERYLVLAATVMADQPAAAVWLLPAAGALTRQAVRAAADPGWNPSTSVCRTLYEQQYITFM